MSLKEKKCKPCEGGTLPLTSEQENTLKKEIPQWTLLRDTIHKLVRTFKFKDFNQAIAFINAVAAIAEQEGHHPNMCIAWNKVTLELFTHAIDGLSENDFIIAIKVDNLFVNQT